MEDYTRDKGSELLSEYGHLPIAIAAESIAFRDGLSNEALWAWMDEDAA